MTTQNDNFKTVHGTLIEIKGLGVLIIGESGVGKSDCALDLIDKGAKFISDDLVVISNVESGGLIGSAPEKIKNLMEIRGIGIINIKDLYGDNKILSTVNINMIIELSLWDSNIDYDRLGIDENKYDIMGIELPYLLIPVQSGRNTSLIVDIAVRNEILKRQNIGIGKTF